MGLVPPTLFRLSLGNLVENGGMVRLNGTKGTTVLTATLAMATVTDVHDVASQPAGAYVTVTLEGCRIGNSCCISLITGLLADWLLLMSHTTATRAPIRVASPAVFQ